MRNVIRRAVVAAGAVVVVLGTGAGVAAASPRQPAQFGAQASTATPGHLYWTDFDDAIMKANLDGTGVTTLVTGQNSTHVGVAVGGSHIYWANQENGTIMEANLDGTGVTTLVIGQNNPTGVAVDSSHIYWANSGSFTIMESNLDGTGVTPVIPFGVLTGQPTWLAVNSSHIYWVNPDNSTIMESNLDGTGVTTLVIGQNNPTGVAVDSSHIYWADDSSGTIKEANLDGTGVTTLIAGVGPVGLAVGGTPPQQLAALGDSYSSGEGSPPFIPGSNVRGDRCHRSRSAYPEHLTAIPAPQSSEFVACSGATAADITNANRQNNEPAQVSALSSATTAVTLTIGGNDIGFANIIKYCVLSTISCKKKYGKTAPERITALGATLISTYAAIHAAAPNAVIVIGGYPDLFAATSVKHCHGFTRISAGKRTWLDSMGDLLNSTIQRAVTTAAADGDRTFFAPVNGTVPGTFTGHQLCSGSSSIYLNAVKILHPVYSFHPNVAGQSAYAKAFDAALKSAGV